MDKADPTPQVENVLEVIREKHRVDIETLVAFEGTFNNNNERDKFYSEYDVPIQMAMIVLNYRKYMQYIVMEEKSQPFNNTCSRPSL
eukprot:6001190-Ditylum_brightwellii.AAC.1